jgi:long-chain acyl-CoA synthetase
MNNPAEDNPTSLLWSEFSRVAGDSASRTAITTPREEATFEQLLAGAENLAARLARSGVKAGHAVGHAFPNSIDFVIAYLALCRLSAVTMLVSTKYQEMELGAIVEGTQPDYLLTTETVAKHLRPSLPSVDGTTALPGSGRESLTLFSMRQTEGGVIDGSWRSPGGAPSEQPSLVKFTSGSTGVPKAILLSAGNVLAEAESVVTGLKLTSKDRILSAVPAFHSYGFDLGVLASLRSGACLELREVFVPRSMLKEMARKDISVYLGVPSMYRFFLETRVDSPPDLSHIRYLLSCTAPLDPQVVEAFHRKFNATICQHYGSSETGGATTHVPSEVLSHSESVGRAMPGVRIRTLDADGNVQPAGAEGEVVVESPAVARKYLMGQEVEPSPLQDGRYLTGDIGRIDKDGYLYVTGRKDKLINVGGLKVSPEEVVRVLESCPAVREAAVTGIREDNNEEIVFAAVTLRSAADENDILEYCHGRLAEYKIPRRIDIREELPRSATGKIRLRPEDMKL